MRRVAWRVDLSLGSLLFVIRYCYPHNKQSGQIRASVSNSVNVRLQKQNYAAHTLRYNMSIPWLSAVFSSVFDWIQLHPILTPLFIVIIIRHVYTWLYPDPLMKLPCPRGGRLFGGHLNDVVKWVSGDKRHKLSADRLLSSALSPILHEKYARELGRNVRLRGIHPVCT